MRMETKFNERPKNLWFLLFTQHYEGDQIKEVTMGGPYGIYGKLQKCI